MRRRVRLLRRSFDVSFLIALAFLVGGVAVPSTRSGSAAMVGQATPAGSPSVAPSPAVALLERASRRLAETVTVRFDLAVDGETALDADGSILLREAEGELQRPDRVRASFRAQVLGQNVTLQLITVGDETWTTDLLTGSWQPAPAEFAYRPSVLFDEQEGIGPVMGRVTRAEQLEDEEVDGRDAYRVRAEVAEEVIGPLTYETMVGSPVTVDLWIDRETDDLLRAELSEPPSEAKADPATWTLRLFDHGDEVSIEAPV